MSRTFRIAAALAASIILAPAVFAQAPAKPVSANVAYSDLDLSNTAGGALLLHRIKVAASKVCDDAVPHSPLTPRAIRACRTETVAGVVRGLNISTLTFAWNGGADSMRFAAR